MTTNNERSLYVNPGARTWRSIPIQDNSDAILKFHQSLPDFVATKLVSLDEVARDIGVSHVLIKDETSRLGLPSFKILGASWGAFRAIAERYDVPLNVSFQELAQVAQKYSVRLYAATDGNHGRAVARMARLLGLEAKIFVPEWLDLPTRGFIAGEDANVIVVHGDYDRTVLEGAAAARKDDAGILIQDTAWDGYEKIPQWIVDGYTTMMREIDQQLSGSSPDVVIVPVGVGSFAQAVVTHSKASGRVTAVIAVEADSAPCLKKSLEAGRPTTIETQHTIMSGMNCGTVSSIAWPTLKAGVDISVTVSDAEVDSTVQYLSSRGVSAGPCGAAPLAALRRVVRHHPKALGLNADSTVVLLCTEGARKYNKPHDALGDLAQ